MKDQILQIIENSTEAAKHAQFYDQFWKIEQIGINGFERLRGDFVVNSIKNHSSAHDLRILDLGCGTGWMSTFVAGLGSYVGTDYSNKAMEYARCVYKDFGNFYLADPNDPYLGITERDFDVVIASEVIEHVKDHKAFLTQVGLFLKEGGLLILTTPNGLLYSIFSRKYSGKLQPIENWLTPVDLKKLLLQNGYNALSHEGILYRSPIYGLKAYLISPRIKQILSSIGLNDLYNRILLRVTIYQLLVCQKSSM
jgi:2-polyprenyl-3-methyl-5-hydroxy-6-metoxy-1,4-benzoquinol methylase